MAARRSPSKTAGATARAAGRPDTPARKAVTPSMPTRFSPDPDLIRKLAEVINETGLTEIEYADGNRRIRVSRAAAFPSVPVPVGHATPTPATPVAATGGGEVSDRNAILAPMVGTAYLAPEPTAPNFVKPGDRVTEGQTLVIIEAMKVMNPIKSPRAGTVKALLIENAAPVEYGQPLLIVE